MPAKLDTAYVKAIVENALFDGLDGTDVTFVMTGDAPDGADVWARLVAVDFRPAPRNRRSSETDVSAFTATVHVAVGASQTNAHALQGALRVVADALDEFVCDETGTNGHLVELERAVPTPDTEPFEDPAIRTGMVQVDGLAQRSSGLTITDYLS